MVPSITVFTLSLAIIAGFVNGETVRMFRNSPVNHTSALQNDNLRWNALASSTSTDISVRNNIFSYVIQLKVGTPGQLATVVVDTGSSVFWVTSKKCPTKTCGKPKEYFDPTKSKTFKKLSKKLDLSYGSGAVSGTEGKDIVAISSNLKATMTFGIATKAEGILNSQVDGILGLRPEISKEINFNPPTIVDYLRSAKKISHKLLFIYFNPLVSGQTTSMNGELTFGSIDKSKVKGSIHYFPISKKSPANQYWGFDHSGIYSGSKRLPTAGTGILDTGTSLVLLNVKVGEAFFKKIPKATQDPMTGLYEYPCANLKKYPNFKIVINKQTYTLTPSEYTLPTYLAKDFGAKNCQSWIGVSDITPFDVILGQKFLEIYASVFDSDNKRMGLGEAIMRSKRS